MTLKGHTQGVLSASFSPDGSRIVTASNDGTAKVWDAQQRRRGPHAQGPHQLRQCRRRSAPTARASSPRATTVRRGSGTPGAAPRSSRIRGHTEAVFSASFSPDGSRIVTGARTRRRRSGTRRAAPRSSHSRGTPAASPRRRSAPTARASSPRSEDGTAKVWDARSGAEALTLKGHTGLVLSASFSPDGSRIVTASDDRTAKVWDARAAPRTSRSRGTPTSSLSAAFSPDGSRIVTASLDKTAKVWDARTGAEALTLKGHTDIRHVGVVQPRRQAHRHRELATARRRSGTRGAAPRPSRSRGTPGSSARRRSAPTARASSPRVTDGTAKVWDAQGGAEALTLKGHTGSVLSASFSPDGTRIVTASGDRTAKVWDAQSGAEALTLKGHTESSGRRRSAPTARASSPRVTTDGEGLGRAERRRGPHAQGPHRIRHVGVVQPRRHAHRHRERRQDGEGLGRATAPRPSRSRGTPNASTRRRSAPTASASSPRVTTARRRVWDAERRQALTLKGHTGFVLRRRSAPTAAHRHRVL